MGTVHLDLDDDLVALLRQSNESVPQAVVELTVMELFRRGTSSGGRAARLLGMPRLDFVRHAADVGIPYFDMDADDWEAELAFIRTL